MSIEKVKVGKGLVLTGAGNLFPEDSYKDLVTAIIMGQNELGIKSENMHIEYHRCSETSSFLAIKLLEGSNTDRGNYMFIGANTQNSDDKISCTVFIHADEKCGREAMTMSNIVSGKAVRFFEETEQDFFDQGMSDIEFSVLIPLKEKIEENAEIFEEHQEVEEVKSQKVPGYKKFLKVFNKNKRVD